MQCRGARALAWGPVGELYAESFERWISIGTLGMNRHGWQQEKREEAVGRYMHTEARYDGEEL